MQIKKLVKEIIGPLDIVLRPFANLSIEKKVLAGVAFMLLITGLAVARGSQGDLTKNIINQPTSQVKVSNQSSAGDAGKASSSKSPSNNEQQPVNANGDEVVNIKKPLTISEEKKLSGTKNPPRTSLVNPVNPDSAFQHYQQQQQIDRMLRQQQQLNDQVRRDQQWQQQQLQQQLYKPPTIPYTPPRIETYRPPTIPSIPNYNHP